MEKSNAPQEQNQNQNQNIPEKFLTTREGVIEFAQACNALISNKFERQAIFDVYNRITTPLPPEEAKEAKEAKPKSRPTRQLKK